MRLGYWAGLSASLLVGCGPTVANSSAGTDTDSAGGSDSTGTDASGGPSSTGSVDGSTTDDTSSGDSSTGGPSETSLCWSSEWTDAAGIEGIWTDDTRVLAAAGTSIITFDGEEWEQLPLEDPLSGATEVAAESFNDAWFGSTWSDVLVHLQAETLSSVDLPLEAADLMSLEVDSGGDPWVLLRPPCGPGLCRYEDPQLFHREGEAWVESLDAQGLLDIDIVGNTMWVVGEQGLVGLTTPGEPWTLLDPPINADFEEVHGVSATEFWVTYSSAYWHYVDGIWSEGTTSPYSARSFSVDAEGDGWWVTKDLSAESSRFEQVEDTGLTFVTSVPDVNAHINSGTDALLAGRDDGNYLYRVSDLGGGATVSTDYGQVDIGGFWQLFIPRPGEALGGRTFGGSDNASGLQWHVDGAWSPIELGPDHVFSMWGLSASLFFAVDLSTGRLWQVADGVGSVAGLPIENPGLARVWGTAEDNVFVCGAPSVGVSGQVDELAVLHWDGMQWGDVSPEDVDNIGGPSSLDMHGVGEHLYVKTALSLYHYDGSSWDSVVAPDLGTELRSVRAYAPDTVFVIDQDDGLLMHDGVAWHVAADVWPELADVQGVLRLNGNAEAGIYLSVYPEEDVGADALWVYRGEAWEPVGLPEGLGRGAVLGVAENGGELWADDGRRIWTTTDCE